MAEPRIVRSVFMDKTLEQHTLQATSPGGRVREHRYETLRTPDGETAGDRANRKKNNRNRALRARKALEKKLTQDTPPAAAPAAAPELPAATERKKRTRVLLPGVRPGSKLAKLSIYEQASAMMEAEALDCDADELLDGDGGGGGSWGMGGWWQDPWEENEIERLRREAAATADRELRARATRELRGHGSERLAELEELLSHDAWQPVAGRGALWREHRLLLEADPLLRSHLAAPLDVEESATYWEPPPCALCGSLLDGAFDFSSGDFWCEPCAKADAEEEERHARQAAAQWRRQEYERRLREKVRWLAPRLSRCVLASVPHRRLTPSLATLLSRRAAMPPTRATCASPARLTLSTRSGCASRRKRS